MSPHPSTSPSQFSAQDSFVELRRRFIAAWQAGETPRLQDFLAGCEESVRDQALAPLVLIDAAFRRAGGEKISPDFYLREFPQLANDPRVTSEWDVATQAAGSTDEQNSADSSHLADLATHTFTPGPAATADGTKLRPNQKIGRYRLEAKVGQGGFGEVWRAFDETLLQFVALKLPRTDRAQSENWLAEVLREAREMARFARRGSVRVLDVCEVEGYSFIVTEYMEGGSLQGRLEKGPLPPADAARIVAEVADALHEAHLAGCVHRDVKPGNILLDRRGQAFLSDFGLAATEEQLLVEEPGTMGTWAYMSPEQASGGSNLVDSRTDIYSLGTVLYLALTDRLPFLAKDAESYQTQLLTRPPRPLRTVDDKLPPELERICLKCLEKRVGDRYSTAMDLASDLRGWLATAAPSSGTATVANSSAATLTMADSSRKSAPPETSEASWLAGPASLAAIVGILVAVVWAVVAWWPSNGGGPPVAPNQSNNTATELRANVWHALFEKPPANLYVPSDPSMFSLHHDAALQSVTAGSSETALFSLGTVAETGYTFRINLQQRRWTGGVGVFVGHRVVPCEHVRCVQFEVIQLVFNKHADRFELRRERGMVHDLGSGNLVHTSKTIAMSIVPELPLGQVSVELVVEDGILRRVFWRGRDIHELITTAKPDRDPNPPQLTGEFGVYVAAADAIFQDARILIRTNEQAP